MSGFGSRPLEALLELSTRPGDWPIWKLVPLPLLLAGGAGWLWAWRAGSAGGAWAIALTLLAFAAADLALFWSLPRWGLSYGPVQPPWLGMMLVRGALALVFVPLAAWRPPAALLAAVLAQAVAWGLLAYGTLLEPFRLKLGQVTLASGKLRNPGPALHLVHLSDLHIERLTRREREALARVAELAPDLILLTGDYLGTSHSEDPAALADLGALLGQLRALAPVYAIPGTPDVDSPDALRPVFEQAGVVLLEDEARQVTLNHHTLWLLGLACQEGPEEGAARLRRLFDAAPEGAFTILLHHTPDLMPQAAALGVDLMLSGHTHGGQWCLPGFGALYTSSRYWKRYEAGHYQQGATHLYVSRGLGMEGYGAPRARFFCPPEVVHIILTGPDADWGEAPPAAARPGAAGTRARPRGA